MNDEAEIKEYFALKDTVTEFDKRLLTIKGWGVTLSLAALGLAFQHKILGMFLVAAISSLAFWWLEAVIKKHQMRFYPRMREIEVNRFERAPRDERRFSAPRIDWGWFAAEPLLLGDTDSLGDPQAQEKSDSYRKSALMAHVMFPHVITLVTAAVLFGVGLSGWLNRLGFAPPESGGGGG